MRALAVARYNRFLRARLWSGLGAIAPRGCVVDRMRALAVARYNRFLRARLWSRLWSGLVGVARCRIGGLST
jgi:hypothetical protein